MRKKYLLLFFVFEVFIFLVVTMIYSYNTIDDINTENSRILSLFSRAQNNLSSSHIFHETYLIQREKKDYYNFTRTVNELKLNIKELNDSVLEIVGDSDDKNSLEIRSNLEQTNNVFESFIETSQAELLNIDTVKLDAVYHLSYEKEFSVTSAVLTKLKQSYLKYYAYNQKQLGFLESIRISITLILFLILLVWLFVYMRRNDKSQTSLFEFNERYKAYFNKTHEGIFRIEFAEPIDVSLSPEKQAELYYEHGFVAECNSAFSRMYGSQNSDELVGMSIINFHGFDNFKKNFNQTVDLARKSFNTENQITIENDKYGNVHYFSNNTFGIIEDGYLKRLWGTQRDVTVEMMEAEEKKILLRAVEQSQVSIVITDLNGKIEYVNPKFEDVTGYSYEEVLGENPRILKSGMDYDSKYKDLWENISKGRTWTGTLHNRKKNGELFFESTIISPITDDSGSIRYFVAVKEDITELTEAQHELQNYKEYLEDLVEKRTKELENRTVFLRTLIDTIPNPVFVKDRNGNYTDVNKAFIDFFGVEFGAVIGSKMKDIESKEHFELGKKTDEELIENAGTKIYESYAIDKNKNKVAIRIFKASFGPPNEKPEGIAGLMVDISESKKTEEQMKKSLEQEKVLNEMKSNFISMASHELRTPLTAIYSSTELLEIYGRKWSEEKYIEHIAKIKYSVDSLIDLMEDLLTLSKVDAGTITFNPSSFNLKSFAEKTISNLESLKNEKHQLSIKIDLKRETYSLDRKLFNYIIQNLLSNALKYSPNGGLVEFILFDDDKNIYLKVRDEGIGIANDEIDKLFEPFYRAQNVADISGTGLGLAIVKDAVNLHNGQIQVKSVENQWTEFEIYLPILE